MLSVKRKMSEDTESDRIKTLVMFREKLVKKIEELETELKDLQITLGTVNSILLEKGFKRPQAAKKPAATEASPPKEEISFEAGASAEPTETPENLFQLKSNSGELLAILHTSENLLRVLPAEDKRFNVNTPPFTQFLIERVLAKMQERDGELARAGQLTTDRIFTYNIMREGDVISEIIIKNIDQERLKELKSSIRWTLEKMNEKTQSQNP